MIDLFLITTTQFNKTGSLGKFFIPLVNLQINIHCLNRSFSRFLVISALPESATWLIFSTRLNWIQKQHIHLGIRKCINKYECISVVINSLEIFFPEKYTKNIKIYIRDITSFVYTLSQKYQNQCW